MNELDSDLKCLLKWAREAAPSMPPEAPFGFSGRVLASRRPVQAPTLLQELHRTAWTLTCVSLVLIVCCGLVSIRQRPAPPPTEEFSSALSFLASNLPR